MLSGRSDKKCPHDFSRGQSGFVEPQAVRTVAMTTSTNPIDSAIRLPALEGQFEQVLVVDDADNLIKFAPADRKVAVP